VHNTKPHERGARRAIAMRERVSRVKTYILANFLANYCFSFPDLYLPCCAFSQRISNGCCYSHFNEMVQMTHRVSRRTADDESSQPGYIGNVP
jgi:hypothetical protein